MSSRARATTKSSARHATTSSSSSSSSSSGVASTPAASQEEMAVSSGTTAPVSQNVKVVLRCRPMSELEMSQQSETVIECEPARKEVAVILGGSEKKVECFHFDKVFDSTSTQEQVYQHVVAEVVEEMLKGYNCTVFAYGQTGTGKTFTMEGKKLEAHVVSTPHRQGADGNKAAFRGKDSGMIPRAIQHIFQHLEACCNDYTVNVSQLELYNEELNDLLANQHAPPPLKIIRDEKRGTVTVSGLEEIKVTCPEDIFKILEVSNRRRQTAETELNKESSRSHCIFTITVHTKEPIPGGEDLIRIGKLNLVDLAGSENTKRSGAVNERLKEAQAINVSLLALGRVITCLTQQNSGRSREHIPYRDSNLTRLLQESLGGRSKTCIIATISPASVNLEETRSTLRYAFRAKNIKNNPMVNHKITKKALIKEYVDEIESLKNQLWAARSQEGFYIDQETLNRMHHELEDRTRQLNNLTAQLQERDEECNNLTQSLSHKTNELQQSIEKCRGLRADLDLRVSELQAAQANLDRQLVVNQQLNWVVDAHKNTELALSDDAQDLIRSVHSASNDCQLLHARIQRQNVQSASQYQAVEQFQEHFDNTLLAFKNQLSSFSSVRDLQYHQWASDFSLFSRRYSDSLDAVLQQLALLQDKQLSEKLGKQLVDEMAQIPVLLDQHCLKPSLQSLLDDHQGRDAQISSASSVVSDQLQALANTVEGQQQKAREFQQQLSESLTRQQGLFQTSVQSQENLLKSLNEKLDSLKSSFETTVQSLIGRIEILQRRHADQQIADKADFLKKMTELYDDMQNRQGLLVSQELGSVRRVLDQQLLVPLRTSLQQETPQMLNQLLSSLNQDILLPQLATNSDISQRLVPDTLMQPLASLTEQQQAIRSKISQTILVDLKQQHQTSNEQAQRKLTLLQQSARQMIDQSTTSNQQLVRDVLLAISQQMETIKAEQIETMRQDVAKTLEQEWTSRSAQEQKALVDLQDEKQQKEFVQQMSSTSSLHLSKALTKYTPSGLTPERTKRYKYPTVLPKCDDDQTIIERHTASDPSSTSTSYSGFSRSLKVDLDAPIVASDLLNSSLSDDSDSPSLNLSDVQMTNIPSEISTVKRAYSSPSVILSIGSDLSPIIDVEPIAPTTAAVVAVPRGSALRSSTGNNARPVALTKENSSGNVTLAQKRKRPFETKPSASNPRKKQAVGNLRRPLGDLND